MPRPNPLCRPDARRSAATRPPWPRSSKQRRPALLAFVERRLGSALRGKLEPQDVLQELAVKALRELPNADLSTRDPFGWLCHLAEQCIVDDHRHFAAGKRASRPGGAGRTSASATAARTSWPCSPPA